MPRFAVGDLLVDLEISERFRCCYEDSGALRADDASCSFAIRFSGITVQGKDPNVHEAGIEAMATRAKKSGAALARPRDDLAVCREIRGGNWGDHPGTNEFWFVGFGNRQLVITLSYRKDDGALDLPALRGAVDASIRSVRLLYPSKRRATDTIEVFDFAESQRPWLEHHRSLLSRRAQQLIGYDSAELIPLHRLDEYWERFVALPPPDTDERNLVLNSVGVALGDHLIRTRSFEWAIVSDSYGVCIAVVALRNTAKAIVDPFDFVAKRWHRRESKFLATSVRSIAETVDQLAAEWRTKS